MEEKYLGLDLGTTTIGIAYSDSLGIIHNYENFSFERGNYKKAREHVIEVCKELEITNIVMGYPLQIDRQEGDRCKSTQRFKEDLLKLNPNLSIILHDESYSTYEAKERLLEGGVKPSDLKKYIDMVSAFVILEDYLRSKK